MSKENWNTKHIKYSTTDWIDTPTIFAQQAISHFPSLGKILDLGCGQGQDSRYFAEHGYSVLDTDFSDQAITFAQQKNIFSNLDFKVLDVTDPLPFEDKTFDIVYSHLALHYFDKQKTKEVFEEITRILKDGGILALLLNSVYDTEYNTGTMIEEDYFVIRNIQKRFFSKESLQEFVANFETLVLDEEGETYKDSTIGVHNLVRYIGKKL